MTTTRTETVEERVIRLLDEINRTEGAWQAMLDVLYRRAVQKRLRETRVLNGWTQQEVADRAGFSQSQLSELENVRYPDYQLATLSRWSRALFLDLHVDVIPRVGEEVVAREETPS